MYDYRARTRRDPGGRGQRGPSTPNKPLTTNEHRAIVYLELLEAAQHGTAGALVTLEQALLLHGEHHLAEQHRLRRLPRPRVLDGLVLRGSIRIVEQIR